MPSSVVLGKRIDESGHPQVGIFDAEVPEETTTARYDPLVVKRWAQKIKRLGEEVEVALADVDRTAGPPEPSLIAIGPDGEVCAACPIIRDGGGDGADA